MFNQRIPIEQASDLIQHNTGNTSFVILDVRTSSEYKAGHIKGAENRDYYSDSFKNDLWKISKEKTYLVYCRTGNRSGKTLEIMKELGFNRVYNMTGGIQAWTAKGFPSIP